MKLKELREFFEATGAADDTEVVFLKDETQEMHLCTMSVIDKSANTTIFFLVGTGHIMRPAGQDASPDPSKLN